jgi:hypothetical protein
MTTVAHLHTSRKKQAPSFEIWVGVLQAIFWVDTIHELGELFLKRAARFCRAAGVGEMPLWRMARASRTQVGFVER